MNTYERKILTILFSTNKTLHEAKVSNEYRLNSITEINNEYRQKMEDVSISPLELPLQKIRNEIYNCLIFSREYVDVLSNISSINISTKTTSPCSKIAFLRPVPKYGSPKRVNLSEFKSSHKLDAVASLSLNKFVFNLF